MKINKKKAAAISKAFNRATGTRSNPKEKGIRTIEDLRRLRKLREEQGSRTDMDMARKKKRKY